jgi:branched-chain amino acid transport system substrate-binding protein
MLQLRAACAALVALLVLGSASTARAADPVKIGFITTLSTAGGYLGEDARDGFLLAMSEEGGDKLGGVPVKLMVEDDGLVPAKGKEIADKFVLQDKVSLFTGIIYSNVALAVVPGLLAGGAFYISPNAAPSQLAGKGCNKNYFVASWMNDNLHEATGQYAQTLGFKKMVLLAPNYPAGKDAITGFKRFFHGQIADEIYTSLDQTDYSAELAKVRADAPDAVFEFLPGGLGINFLKQFSQAGLKSKMKLVLSEASLEPRIVSAVGDDSLGLYGTGHWIADLPYAANKKFVQEFVAKYHRDPTPYASQGYDTAHLIGSALKAVNGDMTKTDAFRAALKKADFASVRGNFRFGSDQEPIEDWYSTRVVKLPNGKLQIRTIGKIARDLGNAYTSLCPL